MRGTDKVVQKKVPPEAYFPFIDAWIDAHPDALVFAASDPLPAKGWTLATGRDLPDYTNPTLAEGWTLARLDKTMLQILRAGTYELIARPDVPKASAISEYVDVAKAFFDDREAKFVNGVLDAVAKDAGR